MCAAVDIWTKKGGVLCSAGKTKAACIVSTWRGEGGGGSELCLNRIVEPLDVYMNLRPLQNDQGARLLAAGIAALCVRQQVMPSQGLILYVRE